MANTEYVGTGKPQVGGAIYRGELSATLPTTVDGAITSFASVGFISSDGVTNSNSMSTDQIKAWGGYIVDEMETEKPDTWKFTMLETANTETAKAVYGDSNVTGTLATGVTIKANTKEQEYKAWVIDTIIKGSIKKRIVIPKAKVTAVEDITYSDGAALGYGVTLSAVPDASGQTHYEYLKEA